jgi:hypothetical protein
MLSYNIPTERYFVHPIERYIEHMTRHFPKPPPNSTPGRVGALATWFLAAALAPGICLAALGQDASTVEVDRVQMRAQRSITQSGAFSVHELQLPGTTRVREYLNSSHRVFAIAWSGPSIPDLQQLLGTYFVRYQAAVRPLGRSRRPVAMQETDLVIHTGGHQRAFFGVAYLPLQLPLGVSAEQIR